MSQDKQLSGIRLNDVLEKRRLDQALNIKEFAVLAGVAYCTAREWFRLPGFPALRGMVFWQDFVSWRRSQNGGSASATATPQPPLVLNASHFQNGLPPRARQILLNAK